MLERDAITAEVVAKDRAAIASLPALASFRLRRDKFHAHFDKKYFTNRDRLQKDAPLKWPDNEAILNIIDTVLNRYSAAYDGNVYSLRPLNARDVDYLLDELHRLREGRARSAHAQG